MSYDALRASPSVAANAEGLARQIWGYFKGDSTGGTGAMQWFDNNKSLGGPAHVIALCRSALSAQVQDVAVAEIVSAHGDPEAFGERELVALVDIQKFPYRTQLYAAAPAKQEGARDQKS